MKLVWSERSWADCLFWQATDADMVVRINELIRDAKPSPFKGLGKPEPLRHELAGFWARRITGEHRLVYRVSGPGEQQVLEIASCRFHYS